MSESLDTSKLTQVAEPADECKVWRRHNCSARHRTYRVLAQCMIRDACWVVGEGPYAVVAWCRVPTISLHEDIDGARGAVAAINRFGCGGRCTRRHELIRLVLP